MVTIKVATKLISKVWANNFRSIESAELELDPLTVLVGPNAAGKSNLMDILRFIQDASIKGLELAIGNRGGIDAVARRSPSGVARQVTIGIGVKDQNWSLEYSFTFANRTNREYGVVEEHMAIATTDLHFSTNLDVTLSNGRLAASSFTYASSPSPDFPEGSQNTVDRCRVFAVVHRRQFQGPRFGADFQPTGGQKWFPSRTPPYYPRP